MKPICAACLLLGLIGVALAQESDHGLQARFDRTDSNKDGKVTAEEVKALLSEWAKALAKAQSDEGDPDEMMDNLDKIEKKYADALEFSVFLKADADDDFTLTKNELKAALAKGEESLEFSVKDLDALIEYNWETEVKPLDKNSNGVLEKTERPKDGGEQFDLYDVNKDGKVTKDEFVAASKKMKWYKEALEEISEAAKREDKHEPKGKVDASKFQLYSKLGRTWTQRTISNKQTTYQKCEVTKVSDDCAELKTSTLDENKKVMPSYDAVLTIEFRVEDKERPDGEPAPEPKIEKIKVEAGEFECLFTVEGGSKYWRSVKYPQLLVKYEFADMMSVELVEFKE